MSQLKAGAVKTYQAPVNLLDTFTDILEKYTSKALRKNQLFKFTLTPQNSYFQIHTDKSQLTTILNNLLDNATNHGLESTTILIEIREHENLVSIKITNQSSIVISDLPGLENEFRKNDVSSDGFGLGLWIVSRLTEIIGAQFAISYEQPFFSAEIIMHK